MKNVGKYVLVFVIFVLIMSSIFIFFAFKRERIQLTNDGIKLLNQVNDYNEGKYSFKNGLIYSESGSLVNDSYLFGGNGDIDIDKYGNVSFDISYKQYHICKNKVGNVTVKNKCSNKKLELELVRNNDTVSFISNYDNLSYKISKKDDFYGNWIKSEGKNIVISSYNTGDNYIWFKDEDGFLSETYKFNVDCLNVNGGTYDSGTFYCLGSKVKLDDKEWIVLESKSNMTTLMLAESLMDRLYMCTKVESDYCFYTNETHNQYKWSNSYVNYYLNNEFLYELSNDTINHLVTKEICDEYTDRGCDEDSGCGGYLKEDITRKNYSCNNYTESKIRVITYEEYNDMYNSLKDLSDFKGNYWILNSYGVDVASTIEKAGNVFILEKPTNKKEVRPVISISK